MSNTLQPVTENMESGDGNVVLHSGILRPTAPKEEDSINFVDPTNGTGQLLVGSEITLQASAISGLAVTFRSDTTAICTVSAGSARSHVLHGGGRRYAR